MAESCKVEYTAPNGFRIVQVLNENKVIETIHHLEEQGYYNFTVDNQRFEEYVSVNFGS